MLVSAPRFARYALIAAIVFTIIFVASRVPRLVHSHLYDLDYETYFQRQFQAYVLTSSCGRFTPDVAEHFDSLILVPNQPDTPECAALNRAELQLPVHPGADSNSNSNSESEGKSKSKDDLFRAKYAAVLDACAAGDKAKCLILEDDVVFLHSAPRTREVLVQNTIALFNDGEIDAFDCTKRGFGWFASTHTGMGSQCRVYSKYAAPCLAGCLRGQGPGVQLDTGLRNCQVVCGLKQRRFLLVVHGGLSSTMDRPGG